MMSSLLQLENKTWMHLALGIATVFLVGLASADTAVLVDSAVLVETNPQAPSDDPLGPDEGDDGDDEALGQQKNASYVSSGGWAVTGANFIDVATYSFSFGATGSVSNATLTLPIETVYAQNDAAPVEVYYFSDDGKIEYTDYSIGFSTPLAKVDAAELSALQLDVTGAVNAALSQGSFVGFKIKSTVPPDAVSATSFPAYAGVKFFEGQATLEFSPGAAPALANDAIRFDGYTLEVPAIQVAGVGEVYAQFRLVDPNEAAFQLTQAAITGGDAGPPPVSGVQLLDCAAIAPPDVTGVAAGIASYSVTSGILDIPSANFNGEQLAVRLEYIEGSDPWMFETLALNAVQSGPSEGSISDLGGGLLVEPTQDFVPLCHGWVLIGDALRNRVVERNLLSGDTGATYDFNTRPGQFTLDSANQLVYMTVHPESERLYKLDLASGSITYNGVEQTLFGDMGAFYEYRWALRDIALGEDGNLFAIMYDGEQFDPEQGIPYADSGLWLGLFDGDANFLTESIPLEEPIRIEYDPVLDHLFLTTESNLATFNFDPATNNLTFVVGTDIPVGTGRTDFDVSPDGTRLAYSCPDGNLGGEEDDFSIVDMDPENYYNNDGEWFLNSAPVSATFSPDGSLLIATDNERLYFFDAARHLLLEDYELGLLEDEAIRKIRVSRDGGILYVFLDNGIHAENGKFYWMPMPTIAAGP